MYHDPEIIAMNQVLETFKYLNHAQKQRVANWVKARFMLMLDKPPAGLVPPVENRASLQPIIGSEGTMAEPAVEEEPKRVVRKKRLSDYFTSLDVFAESDVKKSTAKILLMAAFLQERQDFKEITSYDISFRLKRIKQPVSNISSLINGILKKKPPLIVEIEQEDQAKHSRKKFKITKMGVRVANSYIKAKKLVEVE
jgi:hypothetical protein